MKGLFFILVAFWLRRYEKLLRYARVYLSLPIRLKFLLGRGGAEGAILAKRPFYFAWASPRDLKQTPPPQPASASLRVRSGETLFVKKHCSVKFNKFYFKFDRKIPKQVLIVKFTG